MPAPVLVWARRLNDWANRHEVILLFWTLILFLRAPNLAEPYWYGDEAIYLTIGVALKNGAVLYRDIVDHKTPLIYFLAMVPSQFWFRILAIVWSLVSTSLFFWIAKRWLKRWAALLATLVFVIFTCLPWLEGHIPNGELFVIGFVLAGIWLAERAGLWRPMEASPVRVARWSGRALLGLVGAGMFLSLGLLTKVPALLDVGAIGAALFYAAACFPRTVSFGKRVQWVIVGGLALTLGIVLPMAASVAYFWMRGAATDYLQFGLLYNFHYSGNWELPFSQPWLVALFSLPGKAALLVLSFLITLTLAWRFPRQALPLWATFWLAAALFGSVLSNRPYPHYLIQILPPAALVVGLFFERSTSWISRLTMTGVAGLVAAVVLLLGFGFYETGSYYQSAWQLLRGTMEPSEYRYQFNYLVRENEQLSAEIQSLVPADQPIFIWGTNPMLYAQSKRAPATRFTVAFHIHDLKNYETTLDEIQTKKPKVIVVMKGEQNWPELNSYLELHYRPVLQTDNMILHYWRDQPVTWLVQ